VADAIRAVGKTMASLGAQDLRLERLAPSGKLVYPLNQFLTGLRHEDPNPTRVKPAPLSLINHAYHRAQDTKTPYSTKLLPVWVTLVSSTSLARANIQSPLKILERRLSACEMSNYKSSTEK
jgi:hypothetical protein